MYLLGWLLISSAEDIALAIRLSEAEVHQLVLVLYQTNFSNT